MASRLQFRSFQHKLLAGLLACGLGTACTCAVALLVLRARPLPAVAATVLFALGAGFGLAHWLRRARVQAIAQVTEVARRALETGDYSLRARPQVAELRDLADSLNAVLAQAETRAETLSATVRTLERQLEDSAGTEHALRDSEKRHRTLVAALTSVVWIADAAGDFVAGQPSWETYTGQSEEEYRGSGWRRAFHADDRGQLERLWSHAATARQALDCEARLLHAMSGRHRLVSLRALPVLDADGEVREWVGTVTDIDDRRRAEEEILRLNAGLEKRVQERTAQLLEANRELEAFSFSVSHDLRAPLRAIDGFSEALLEDFGERVDDEMREFIRRIRQATLRMGQLIEDLLNLARISRTELQAQPVDVSTMARRTLEELAQQEPGRPVEVRIEDGVIVEADPRLLRVAMENLLGNAWKFTSRTSNARIEFGTLREGSRSVLFVRDNGAGFDMEHADKLFGPFQRLHSGIEFPGTGIGLATVQRIVQRHRGRIWAQAQPGMGATFYFTLGDREAAANEPRHEERQAQWPTR